MLHISIIHDTDSDNPCECDGWKVFSFSRRHASYCDAQNLPVSPEQFKEMHDSGLAFWLSYYEHGTCGWYLTNSEPAGFECQWDGRRHAGMLIWMQDESDLGPKDRDSRAADAANFLEDYTSWCNGCVYGYTSYDCNEDNRDDDTPSCFGFYEEDDLLDNLALEIGPNREFRIDECVFTTTKDAKRRLLSRIQSHVAASQESGSDK